MYRRLTFILMLLTGLGLQSIDAQKESKWKELDKSPMDMMHYPENSAWRNYLTGDDRNKSAQIRLTYSKPAKNDRVIFGGLVPYGKEWRLGANEANEITFYQAVDIQGQSVPRGNYTFFATPHEDHWIISFSSERNLWGAENRDAEKTVATAKVMTSQLDEAKENLGMTFQRIDDESVNLIIAWDKTQVTLPIGFNPIVFANEDASPMDQIHFPDKSAYTNYLKADEKENISAKAKLIYSRPQKKDRVIFGELLKYGEMWRIGANQSTEITLYSNVTINGKDLRRGTYNMYAMVNEDKWDIIFNTDRPAWGHANRDEEKDVLTITVPVQANSEDLEVLNIKFEEKSADSADLIIAWEKTMVSIPIVFKS